MLTSKERAELRSQATMLDTTLMVGKGGITEALIAEAIRGVRISFMFYPIVGFQMVTSNFFRSIGYAGTAIFLSLTRQLIFLLPFIFILPRFFGLDGIWASMPLADLTSCVISASIMIYHLRKLK